LCPVFLLFFTFSSVSPTLVQFLSPSPCSCPLYWEPLRLKATSAQVGGLPAPSTSFLLFRRAQSCYTSPASSHP
jgi:hypothetical protein